VGEVGFQAEPGVCNSADSAPDGVHLFAGDPPGCPPSKLGSPSLSARTGQPLAAIGSPKVPGLHGGYAGANGFRAAKTTGSIVVGGAIWTLFIVICEFAETELQPQPVMWLVKIKAPLNL